MYLRLAAKNLLSQKSRTILTSLGISIGIASLVLLLGLSEGLQKTIFQNLTNQSPLTQLTVQSSSAGGGFLKLLPNTDNNNRITSDKIDTIKILPHVKSVNPEMNYSNISSVQINLLGKTFQTDSMIFGVPYEFIAADLPANQKESWQNPAEPYPAILPRKIIDLYNLTVAPGSNLPNFSENSLLGLELNLMPDYSSLFSTNSTTVPKTVKIKVVGFSDKVSLVGPTLPLDVVRNLNLDKNPAYQDSYLRLFVEVDEPKNVENVSQQIERTGLKTFSSLKEVDTIENNFRTITIGLSLVSLIILLVAGFMIASTFLSNINERRHEIGIFRAIGATRGDIQKIFLAEAGVLGGASGIIGITLALVNGLLINQYLLKTIPILNSRTESFFYFNPLTIGWVFLFSIILSLVFAFIPSVLASRLNPLDALLSK